MQNSNKTQRIKKNICRVNTQNTRKRRSNTQSTLKSSFVEWKQSLFTKKNKKIPLKRGKCVKIPLKRKRYKNILHKSP